MEICKRSNYTTKITLNEFGKKIQLIKFKGAADKPSKMKMFEFVKKRFS